MFLEPIVILAVYYQAFEEPILSAVFLIIYKFKFYVVRLLLEELEDEKGGELEDYLVMQQLSY